MDRIFGNRRHGGDGDNNTFVDIERNDSMHSDSKSQSHFLRHHKRFGAQRSDQRPLTTIDVVEEIRSNYERCRLLLVEIARRKTPSASRIFKDKTKTKLEGSASELDLVLCEAARASQFSRGLTIPCMLWHQSARTSLSSKVEREGHEMLKIQHQLIMDDLKIKRYIASARLTFLKLDKQLRESVVHPLKHCMIHNQTLDYDDLRAKTRRIQEDVKRCLQGLLNQADQRQDELMEKAMIDWLGQDWKSEEAKKRGPVSSLPWW